MHFSEISQKRPALDFFRDWKNTYLIDKNFVAFNFRRSQFSSDIIFVTKPTLSLLSYENSQQIIVSFSCYSYYLLLIPILASSAIVSYLCNRLRWVCNRCSFFCYVRIFKSPLCWIGKLCIYNFNQNRKKDLFLASVCKYKL